jgi:hypothetical protein
MTDTLNDINRYTYSYTGLDRPLGLQEIQAHEGSKVVSPTHRALLPLPQEITCIPFFSPFFLEWNSVYQVRGLLVRRSS